MFQLFPRNITTILFLLPLPLVLIVLTPLTVLAEPGISSCPDVSLQIEQTQRTLRPLEQRQQQLQQQVRAIYQELFACQTGSSLALAQQRHCTQLQEEGPKQFQAMVAAITLHHRTSQQLAHQIHHMPLACPANTTDTLRNTLNQPSFTKIARNN